MTARMIVSALGSVGLLSLIGSNAAAQQSSGSVANAPIEPVFESHGIRVTAKQASLSKDGSQVDIVAIVENRNEYDILAALLAKLPIATDNKGHSYVMDVLWRGVNGIATCTYASSSYSDMITMCLDPTSKGGLPVEAYTTLSKHAVATVVLSMSGRFNLNDPRGDNVSFSALMAIRKAPGEDDVSKSGTVKLAPATTVPVGVALIPLEKSQ